MRVTLVVLPVSRVTVGHLIVLFDLGGDLLTRGVEILWSMDWFFSLFAGHQPLCDGDCEWQNLDLQMHLDRLKEGARYGHAPWLIFVSA